MEIRDYALMDDRALVRLVVEGDSRAFEPLFMRHKDIIYTMLVKRSCNPDDVDDMLQEAFMKAFVNINRYNPDYDFGAWICTIAKNTFVDFIAPVVARPLIPIITFLSTLATQIVHRRKCELLTLASSPNPRSCGVFLYAFSLPVGEWCICVCVCV